MESAFEDSDYPFMEAASTDDLMKQNIMESETAGPSSISLSNFDHESNSGGGAVVLTVRGLTNSSGQALRKHQRPGIYRSITKNSLDILSNTMHSGPLQLIFGATPSFNSKITILSNTKGNEDWNDEEMDFFLIPDPKDPSLLILSTSNSVKDAVRTSVIPEDPAPPTMAVKLLHKTRDHLTNCSATVSGAVIKLGQNEHLQKLGQTAGLAIDGAQAVMTGAQTVGTAVCVASAITAGSSGGVGLAWGLAKVASGAVMASLMGRRVAKKVEMARREGEYQDGSEEVVLEEEDEGFAGLEAIENDKDVGIETWEDDDEWAWMRENKQRDIQPEQQLSRTGKQHEVKTPPKSPIMLSSQEHSPYKSPPSRPISVSGLDESLESFERSASFGRNSANVPIKSEQKSENSQIEPFIDEKMVVELEKVHHVKDTRTRNETKYRGYENWQSDENENDWEDYEDDDEVSMLPCHDLWT